ncbi:3D domain-containing protein [Tepidibacter formicigenes]|jgi:uncharacterized protein YabE (DUF348 family)|uniref:G5 domain-containing protein n=1 Tax=Tepidibacter formicigenes DSM 15518 TaxID=1123349 RepID=A0A1M6T3J4_9FIRM|nr:3D domain-containing protein [Tepidibacter formicigenes]SHK51545.1 protein of unknown function [Tepidibacter formicigenes DSM 15518]
MRLELKEKVDKLLEFKKVEKLKEILEIKKVHITIISIVLVLGCIGIYDALNNKVTIAFDNKKENVRTFSKTVKELLEEKNIKLGKNDKVLPGLNSKLKDNTQIVVRRAFEVDLVLNGQTRKIITTENTVKDLLEKENITISKLDKLNFPLDHKLRKNDQIKLVRVQEQIVTQVEEVPFGVETVYDDNLDVGKFVQVQKGSNGQKEVTYKIVLNDGKEVSKTLIDEKVILDPTNEIVKKGTKNFIVTSRGDVRRFKKTLDVTATAYTAGFESTGKKPGDSGYGKTYMGTTVRPGVIAVDPKVIPLGSKVYIPYIGKTCTAEDIGGAIKGNKIDIYMSELSKAKKFGRKKLKVYILE